jgi:nitrogenase molybdenum-iron protein alpha/beta subunit
MKPKSNTRREGMTNEDRRLIVEPLGEMRELKGEMKEHVIERVQRLEKKEAERSKERLAVVSVLISSAALAVSVIVNFFKRQYEVPPG